MKPALSVHSRAALGMAAAVLGMLLAPAPALAGGGWTRHYQKGYVKVGLTTVGTTRYHPLAGCTVEHGPFPAAGIQRVRGVRPHRPAGGHAQLPGIPARVPFPALRPARA